MWRVGASSATLLDRTAANSQIALAADSKGRIWAVWSDGTFGDTRVLAARSNPEATRVRRAGRRRRGARTRTRPTRVDARATASALDILALFGTGDESGGATYHARVRARPDAEGAQVAAAGCTFTVTDAGDPVRGATVKRRPLAGAPTRKGRVTLHVAQGHGDGDRARATSLRSCGCDELLRPARRRGVLAPVEPDEDAQHRPRQAARGADARRAAVAAAARASPRRGTATTRRTSSTSCSRARAGCGSARTLLTLPRLSAVLVEPDDGAPGVQRHRRRRAVVVVGAPPEPANTLEMSPETLACMYPDGPKALPPELEP